MHVAICDDNTVDLEHLEDLALRYGRAQGLEMEVAAYQSTAAYLEREGQTGPDVLLLDIYMSETGADGLELAGKLRDTGFEGPLILVTSSRDHFADGYTVGALHYLVKPVAEADFAEAMRRARLQLREDARTLTVTSNRRQTTLLMSNILYVEVQAHQTRLITTRGAMPASLSLAEVVERIGDEARFLKCFRSYVVNMDHIKRMDGDHFVMDNGDRVPIAKREAAAIEARYVGYSFAKGGKL